MINADDNAKPAALFHNLQDIKFFPNKICWAQVTVFYQNNRILSKTIALIFVCLSVIFLFFNWSLFHFLKSTMKTVLPDIDFSIFLIGIFAVLLLLSQWPPIQLRVLMDSCLFMMDVTKWQKMLSCGWTLLPIANNRTLILPLFIRWNRINGFISTFSQPVKWLPVFGLGWVICPNKMITNGAMEMQVHFETGHLSNLIISSIKSIALSFGQVLMVSGMTILVSTFTLHFANGIMTSRLLLSLQVSGRLNILKLFIHQFVLFIAFDFCGQSPLSMYHALPNFHTYTADATKWHNTQITGLKPWVCAKSKELISPPSPRMLRTDGCLNTSEITTRR